VTDTHIWAECSHTHTQRGSPLSDSAHIHNEVSINELPVSIPAFSNTQVI